ncbi:MAG: hypothetical protein K0R21_1868, partial [Anaerocolumna sp.]|nr:hypothetical protein [Anaerocolumna sp.]
DRETEKAVVSEILSYFHESIILLCSHNMDVLKNSFCVYELAEGKLRIRINKKLPEGNLSERSTPTEELV